MLVCISLGIFAHTIILDSETTVAATIYHGRVWDYPPGVCPAAYSKIVRHCITENFRKSFFTKKSFTQLSGIVLRENGELKIIDKKH
jgi:hypothetical protein